ncbi:MAG: hypothetical protein ACK4SZ_00260 [Allosphingosinicella sp.]
MIGLIKRTRNGTEERLLPLQAGDMSDTFTEISAIEREQDL